MIRTNPQQSQHPNKSRGSNGKQKTGTQLQFPPSLQRKEMLTWLLKAVLAFGALKSLYRHETPQKSKVPFTLNVAETEEKVVTESVLHSPP